MPLPADRMRADLRLQGAKTAALERMITELRAASRGSAAAGAPLLFSRSATIIAPSGAAAYVVARLPRAATVTAVSGYRSGGTGATINAAVGGVDLLPVDLSLSTDATWLSGPSVQALSLAAGDSLAVAVRSVSGSPGYVTIQIDMQGV